MMSKDKRSQHPVRLVVGILIAVPLVAACHHAVNKAAETTAPVAVVAPPTATTVSDQETTTLDAFEQQAHDDPLVALRTALAESEKLVREYTCTFVKQERVRGKLLEPQSIRVKYRSKPFSVLMEWLENPYKCERVLYVKGKWKNGSGKEQAWADPTGWAVDILLGKKGGVLQEIHGSNAKATARRTVDQFGFVNTLRLLVHYAELARSRGELSLEYLGRSRFEGRATYLFKRVLPYTGEKGDYPERYLLAHLDQETRLPIAVFTWADDEQKTLLGSYITKNFDLNPGLSPQTFSKEYNKF